MADRKVLNKYYPPDFDVTKLPRLRINPVKTFVVRIMAPFNMRCKTCGEYIYKGKKFNSKKEDVLDMDYLGLKIFRFFIKCTRCLAEISFRTDPENCDYVCEQGATRNFQAHDFAEQEEKRLAKLDKEDEANPMKVLEKRTMESKNEMDIMDALEELKDLNSRHANATIDSMLESVTSKLTPQEKADAEDARLAAEAFSHKRKQNIKLEDDLLDHESDDIDSISNFSLGGESSSAYELAGPVPKKKPKLNNLVVRKKKKTLPTVPSHHLVSSESGDKKDSGAGKMPGKTLVSVNSGNAGASQSSTAGSVGLSLLSNYSCSDSD